MSHIYVNLKNCSVFLQTVPNAADLELANLLINVKNITLNAIISSAI